MSAAMDWPSEADPEWDRQSLVPALATSLVVEFGDELRSLGPVWLRTDPSALLWLAGPVSIVAIAMPSPLLRVVVTLLVAVGVGLQLRWQAALAAHKRRSETFVVALAHEVAAVLASELPALILEEISMGKYRSGLEQPILHAASKRADAVRRVSQGGWL